ASPRGQRVHGVHRAHSVRGGHATVELVLALPVLMIFILGIADVGRVMTTSAALHRAVATGAIRAIDKTLTDSVVKSIVIAAEGSLNLSPASITITRASDSLVVNASTTVTSFAPLSRWVWPTGTITVNAAAVTRVTP